MENTDSHKSVLILTGMHRSGTSLTASLLSSAGVNLGERLMGSREGNLKGHFEDLDFIEFHQNVFQSQGISIAGWTTKHSIEVQEEYREQAKILVVTKHQSNQIWGWKDPRTTLFLDFWREIIPEAKFIFVYRSPWEVIDSLYRRGDVPFQTNPNFALQIWISYNQALLNFSDRFPDSSIIFRIEDIISQPNFLINSLNAKFKLQLKSPQQLYDSALFSPVTNSHRPSIIKNYFPEVWNIYLKLHKQAHIITPVEPTVIDESFQFPPYRTWVLQDWQDNQQKAKQIRQLQQQLQQTQEELSRSQQQLQEKLELHLEDTKTARENLKLQQQLQQSQCQQEHLQQQLRQADANQEHLQQQLQHIKSDFTQSQQRLQQQSQSYQQQLQQQLRQADTIQQQLQQQLQQSQSTQQQLQTLIAAMESSKFWQIRQFWFNFRQIIDREKRDDLYQAYRGSSSSIADNRLWGLKVRYKRIQEQGWEYLFTKIFKDKLPKVVKSLLEPESPSVQPEPDIPRSNDNIYQQWLNKHYPNKAHLDKMAKGVETFKYKPTISIIVPVYNPPEKFLREAIESVQTQIYPYWELCLADDLSTKPYVRQVLNEYSEQDDRIKVVFRQENGHISRASNSALEIAQGDYIALLDHDDVLTPHALYEVVSLLNEHPEADMIYSDEDKINEENIIKDPFFKMDWCPDSFLSRMYTCHLGVYRRSLIIEIGNFRVGFEGSQDYDLVLRFTEKTDKIFHIPKILYHWRMHSQSAAAGTSAKPYAYEAAKKALSQALERRNEPGKIISIPGYPGLYTVRYEIKEPALVSIIIPTKDLGKTLNTCLKSIFDKSTYPHYEIIVIDNGSIEKETFKCFDYWQNREPTRFKSYRYDIPFNYSQINNYGVQKAQGKYLLFLNNDTEIITADWIEGMVEQAQRPSIGAVGGLLLYPDKTIQHAGVVLGIGGVASHSHKCYPSMLPGYFGQVITINNYSAVTAACLMCRREVFTEVGGFEEDLAIAYNDVDFCLKLLAQGYRNIYLPHVTLFHYESKSRGKEDTPEKLSRLNKERAYVMAKWQHILENDPCYSPHLTKDADDYSINLK